MMEQWNDVQEKRGSDAEHRNQDSLFFLYIISLFQFSIIPIVSEAS